jgi:Arc/MetJ-type ribon-helix-helix transcriptional regulator
MEFDLEFDPMTVATRMLQKTLSCMLDGMLTQLALRVPDECIAGLDELVNNGEFANRAEAARFAVVHFLEDRRTARDVRRVIESYTDLPQSPRELAEGEEVLRGLIAEEPW